MNVYIDTSAFLAVLNAGDEYHAQALPIWNMLLDDDQIKMHTNSFVLVESYALIQNRLGFDAVKTFYKDMNPVLVIHWVEKHIFEKSILPLLSANRKKISLVDCTSFITMLTVNINKVFTFDRHFKEQGFEMLSLK